MQVKHYILPLLLSITLLGCNKSSENSSNSAANTPASTSTTSISSASNPQQQPKYLALSDMTYPPFEEKDSSGKVTGMDIEIFNAIAKDQGFNVDYIPHTWDGIFEQLNKDANTTLIVSAVTRTEEAKKNALLSDMYYISPYRVVSLDQSKMKNWQQQPKIGISDSEDSATDLPKQNGVKPEQLVHFKTVFLALGALVKGDVDTVVADSTVMQYYMGNPTFKNTGKTFYQEDFDYTHDEGGQLVFAVKKGHEDLLAKINTGLANIKKSGELNRILEKYGQNPAEVEKKLATVTATSGTTASVAKP